MQGKEELSLLERCPHFKIVLREGSTVFHCSVCPCAGRGGVYRPDVILCTCLYEAAGVKGQHRRTRSTRVSCNGFWISSEYVSLWIFKPYPPLFPGQVQGSREGVKKALGLVWSQEQQIKDSLVETYVRLFLKPQVRYYPAHMRTRSECWFSEWIFEFQFLCIQYTSASLPLLLAEFF